MSASSSGVHLRATRIGADAHPGRRGRAEARHGCSCAGSARRAIRPTSPPSGEDALWMARATSYDVIVLDVMLPGIDGFATCGELRTRGRLDAGADADRPRRARGPRRRVSTRAPTTTSSSRSPSASCSRGCGRSRGGPRPSVRPSSGSATSGSTRPPTGPGAGQRARADREGVRAARGVHAAAGRGALPGAAPRCRLGHRLREPLERRRRLCPLPAREDRSPVRAQLARDRARGRLPAGRGFEPAPDPDPADAAVRARDGGRAGRARRVRLRAGQLDASAHDRPEPARPGDRGDAAARPGRLAARP